MGKKKAAKKTKELSVAIAEASTVGGDETQQQQPLTPRKRGRPRKIVDQKSEISEEEAQEIESKKSKTSEEDETSISKKEEGQFDQDRELSLTKEEPFSRRSRVRRKGKPRKSS